MGLLSKTEWLLKWGGVSAIAPLLIALAVFSYRAVDRNQRDVDMLGNVDLPLLNDIQNLRTALIASESAVYEYYLTTDVEHFNERFSRQTTRIQKNLAALSSALDGAEELQALSEVSVDIQVTTQEFQYVMANSPIDWDAAREVLARFGPLTARAISESEALGGWVQGRVLDRSESYAKRVEQTLYLVSFLMALAAIAAAWLARSNYTRNRALREQQRLASFPSSNPQPVLALNLEGQIIYANEAAYAMAHNGDLTSLLPDDLYAHLTCSEAYAQWDFEKEGKTFQISLGYLKGYGEYHAYMSDITARKKAEDDLAYLAYHDATTGLINRQQFNEFVEGHLNDDVEASVLVAIMDLDLLDKVVAASGVSVAEKVARIAAMRLQHTITEESYFQQGCLSYVGGGLFCFAYPNDKVEAELIFRRMQEAIARPLDVDGFEFYLSLSIGVALGEDINLCASEEALRLADGALQQAKIRGVGLIEYYEHGIEAQHQYRMLIEHGLRNAIERDELQVYYQPKVSLMTGKITSVEALVRWQHPELGFVSPAEFIPIAEDTGQILEIGPWVLEQACEDLEAWNAIRTEPVSVAVNLSAKQLLHSDISAQVLNASRRFDVPVSWIELEITETAALSDFERALEKLQQLDTLGIKLSLDDFGTGFSSLSYLQQLPVSVLKIDRSFITPLATGCNEETLTHSIINMAQQLQLEVVAEGVETEGQMALLKKWGCEYVQGYYIAKPMPYTELTQFLHNFDK